MVFPISSLMQTERSEISFGAYASPKFRQAYTASGLAQVMKTKLKAAGLATAQGIDTTIINGRNPEALYRIIEGKSAGTLFAGMR